MSLQVSEAFAQLKPYKERRFLPPNDINLADKDVVVAFYQQLLDRDIDSTAAFEQWILDRSELDAAVSQTSSMLYVAMTCHTDDSDKAQAYQHFIQDVAPAIKPLGHALNQCYLTFLEQFPLDAQRYEVYTRSVRASVDLFIEKNIALETQIDLLSQEYQSICGAMTVDFDGEERTLPQMSKYLYETNRDLRERAWRATAERRQQDQEKINDVFNQMVALRCDKAVNAGCDSFIEYQFKAYHRFDYGPQQCKQYHDVVEKIVVPVAREIAEHRRQLMNLEVLKPWDTLVDAQGLPPLKPFTKVDELIQGVEKMFYQTDQDLGQQFTQMRKSGLLDLASRKGKAPGGYQVAMSEARKPFIFMNAVGLDSDVNTLLHEGGHAFHALACAHDDLDDYRHAPMEFCEVASMAMELLAGQNNRVFYNETDAMRSRREHLEGIIQTLTWVATIDAFQFWIYEHPNHTNEERTQAWLSMQDRFGTGVVDWGGLESYKASAWHRQLHVFEVPFYYIEYAIAQLGALQIWITAKDDHTRALAGYKKGLALGGSRPLPELYAAAGIRFDFSEDMIKPLVHAVYEEWQEL